MSEYAARYSNGFAKNVCWYLLRSRVSGELPLELSELCLEPSVSQEQLAFAGEIKARRCRLKRVTTTEVEGSGDLTRKAPRKKFLEDVFRRIQLRAPRAGTVILGNGEILFGDAQKLCSTFEVTAAEICRGTDRFRVPKGSYDDHEVPLRHTFIMHRNTGEVEEIGEPEEWLKLPKAKRTLRSKPAKLCLTVFGKKRVHQVPLKRQVQNHQHRNQKREMMISRSVSNVLV